LQEVQPYPAMTRSVLRLAGHLASLGVTRVVMEADYWKPVFYLLEAAGLETWLVNAKDVKHLPGRPKTGKLDAVWLCKVAERQMLRPSFVPPPPIRQLRDLTRYRHLCRHRHRCRYLALWLISDETAATFHIPVTIRTANAIQATWLKRRAAARGTSAPKRRRAGTKAASVS